LLGTSLTGLADCPPIPDSELQALKQSILTANQLAAFILGINSCASATNVKPSGTVSQLCDCSPGRHTRYAQFFLRNVRIDKKDPVYTLLLAQGYPVEDEKSKPDSTAVVTFPLKAPEGAKTRHDFTALEQCEDWLRLLTNWAQHNVSTTIYVNDNEWQEVGEWVFRNLDRVSGMAFFPTSNHTYIQAPYDEVTEEQWAAWVQAHPVPSIDWSRLPEFEKEDETTSSQELACAGGACLL
jgi:ribonucleoside-diphosphate reductase alpha chain